MKGSLREIEQQLEQWRNAPTEPKVWLDIEIATDEYLHDMQRQVQALTDELPVEVVLLRRSREQRERVIASQHKETLSELSVEEVFERRLSQEETSDERAARLRTLFAQTLSDLHQQEEQA
ncbi:Nuclease sbcCD subunit D [Cedecea neteri]|uniref:Nuclease sbcCD subunit D n=1 Tax=Cedecea neteri TaxID=158822 RepID=A0A2X2V637_9ENTR|nr:Nuclease sbcCD subunit D [Cedecea neteri]